MYLIYPVERVDKDRIQEALDKKAISGVQYKDNDVSFETNLSFDKVEELIHSSVHYSTLKKEKFVLDAVFNYQKKLLTVTTLLNKDEIMAKAKEIEDEIVFLDEEKWIKRTYKVDIDCEDCALEVEEALRKNPNIKDVSFNYPKGKLILTTTLSDKEIVKLAKEAEDEIVFLSVFERREETEQRVHRRMVQILALREIDLPHIGG